MIRSYQSLFKGLKVRKLCYNKESFINNLINFFYVYSFIKLEGRAYLFDSVVNVACGQAEERVLLTGERHE